MTHTCKRFCLMLVYAVLTIIYIAPVQTFAQLPTPDYSGSLWERSTLTGDWGCMRNELTVAVYDAVYAAGMSFSFPQRDVHIIMIQQQRQL